jgi:hypothetical protein
MRCKEPRKHEKCTHNFDGKLEASDPREGRQDNTPTDIRKKTRVRTEQDLTGSGAEFCEHGSIKAENVLEG